MISPKTIRFNAYRCIGPERHSIFRGGAVRFIVTIDPSIDLTGCSFLRLEMRESATDSNSPLAVEEIADLSSREFEFVFSSAQTNYNITSAWLVLSGYFPEAIGDSDDNIDPLYISELSIIPHNASILAPSPPNPSVALNQTSADNRYVINSGDSRILLGRYSNGTGILEYISISNGLYINSGSLSINTGVVATINWVQSELDFKVNTSDLGTAAFEDSSNFISAIDIVPANTFLAGSSSGAGLAPEFRIISTGDLPSGINASYIGGGSVSNTEFNYLNGTTGNIQSQLDLKASSLSIVRNFITGYANFDFGNESDNIITTIPSSSIILNNVKSYCFIPYPSGNTSIDDFRLNGLSFSLQNIINNTSFDIEAVALNKASDTYIIKYLIEI